MGERKITLKIPKAYEQLVEDIRLLKSDEQNPNRMTIKQKEQTWKSLQEDGWAYPIVTDLNGVFADGEQLAEKRGWHWALTSFVIESWGE